MSPSLSAFTEYPPDACEAVLRRMQQLHAASAVEKSDVDRIRDGMSSQIIGETTQRAHQALVTAEVLALHRRAAHEHWAPEVLLREVEDAKLRIAEEMFREHWFESTLSTPDHPIHAATYGTSKFRYDLRMLMTGESSPEDFTAFAWLTFDANGLRSFKDCTSHEETTAYLQGAARIFVSPTGPTRARLERQGIRVIPMATGGDEFVLYLRSSGPLNAGIVDDAVASYQEEIRTSPGLTLDLDDESVLIKFGMPSSRQRKEFARLGADERRRTLDGIRASLPDRFIPSFAGGGALLTEGIARAVEKDDHDLQGDDEDFAGLREKIVRSTIDLAEYRQKKNKEARRMRLVTEDPKRYAFELRNGENRELAERIAAMEHELAEARQQYVLLLSGNGGVETSA